MKNGRFDGKDASEAPGGRPAPGRQRRTHIWRRIDLEARRCVADLVATQRWRQHNAVAAHDRLHAIAREAAWFDGVAQSWLDVGGVEPLLRVSPVSWSSRRKLMTAFLRSVPEGVVAVVEVGADDASLLSSILTWEIAPVLVMWPTRAGVDAHNLAQRPKTDDCVWMPRVDRPSPP